MKRISLAVYCLCFCIAGFAQEKTEAEKIRDTIAYGIESQVIELLDTLKANEDDDYLTDLTGLYKVTRSPALQAALFNYFSARKSSALADSALEIISDRDNRKKEVVQSALQYLAVVAWDPAGDAAADILNEREDDYITEAVKLLAALKNTSHTEVLIDLFHDDETSDTVRQQIILALGGFNTESVFELLEEVLSSEASSRVDRMYAASALGQLADRRAVPLLSIAAVDSDPYVRQYAVTALQYFPKDDAASTVLEALRDSHVLPRAAACKVAGILHIAEAEPFLIYKVRSDPETSVRTAAVDALVQLGDETGQKFLVEIFEEYVPPAEKINKILHCIDAPGLDS